MKLSEIREAYEDISRISSTVNRQLCFAGIGIIWIFNKSSNSISVPHELFLPSFLFILSLFLDIVQYYIQTIIWHRFYLSRRRKGIKEGQEADEPESYNTISWIFFYSKVAVLIVGYVFLGIFLL